jgi:hypothetical protein
MPPTLTTMTWLTFLLGQRLADVARLRSRNFEVFRHPSFHLSGGGKGSAENWLLHNQFPASIERFHHLESMEKHHDRKNHERHNVARRPAADDDEQTKAVTEI